jgi:hypothetical protein
MIFWHITPCSPEKASYYRGTCPALGLTLMMEVIRSSETMGCLQIMPSYNPSDHILHTHCCEHLEINRYIFEKNKIKIIRLKEIF